MALKTANNQSMTAITALPSAVAQGGLVLISTTTASDDGTISITSGIDSTYKEYIIKLINIHPGTNDTRLTFQGSIDAGSNYNVTMTTTAFRALHTEDDTANTLSYQTSADLAQATGFQRVGILGMGSDNDENGNGHLHLFNPSSTTFVKHVICRFTETGAEPRQVDGYMAGYFNTTSAVNAVQFKMSDGNIGSGTFKLYGVT